MWYFAVVTPKNILSAYTLPLLRKWLTYSVFLAGPSNYLSIVDLHVPRSSFCMKSVYSNTTPWYSSGTRVSEWIMPVRVGTASLGTARFPSHCRRLGCTLHGGTCACQMLFSLSRPNVLISFCCERTKSVSEPKILFRQHCFCLTCVISTL